MGLIYNHCTVLHKRYYRLYGKYLDKFKLQKYLVKLKKHKKFAYIGEIGSQAVQDVTDRIERAYKLFWSNRKRKKKSSPPKFKKVRRYRSFTLKQAGWKLDKEKGKIRIGQRWHGYFQYRKIEGKVKTVTIKRDAVGDIYIYLVCDVQCNIVKPRTGKSVGFDFGLKQFLTGSDGNNIKSPYFFMLNIKEIRKKCRKVHSLDFYSVVEILKYEALKLGTGVILVDRYFLSSQLCSVCGHKNAARFVDTRSPPLGVGSMSKQDD